MENRLNIIAGLSSLFSLIIAALPSMVSKEYVTKSQSIAALILSLALFIFFYWLRRHERSPRSIIKKKDLVRVACQHIDSAANKVVIFSNDLSWVNDYAESIRKKIDAQCKVVVLHKKSTDNRVIQNSNYLRGLGVEIIELDEDHRLRATLIDPDDPYTARLFIAHKTRRDGSASPLKAGESGTDQDFHYECAVYQNGADKVLTSALARLAMHGFPARA